MSELTAEQRLGLLERHAHVTCFRCQKIVPFDETRILNPQINERLLCFDCYSGYDDLVHNKETETTDAIHTYLRELRPVKY